MKPDARIADIIETLSDAEEYVRGIVGSSIQHSFDKERSSVTIDISGTGLYPNYYPRAERNRARPEKNGFQWSKSSRNSRRLPLG